jgi:hypothetical protein
MENNNAKIEEIIQQNKLLLDSNSQYQQIVEKTNSQLSLWGNPYGVMVGGLGVLVAFLAIGITIYTILQNNKSRKIVREELDRLFNDRQKSSLELIENKGLEIEEKLKTAHGEEKKSLEEEKKRIKNLELEIKAGMPDFSQYMKKEDFLCKDCLNRNPSMYSIFPSAYEPVKIRYNFDLYILKRKCLICGNEFD